MALSKDRASVKTAAANVILVANAFIWYLIAFNSLKALVSNADITDITKLMILGANTGAIALAGLIGTFIVGKFIRHRRFLNVWIASGIVLSLLPLAINGTDPTQITILSIVFGAYFGLGMPATMGHHSSLTKVENRAKIGGLTFLIIGITFAFTSIIAQTSLLEISIILVAVRIIGLITMRLINNEDPPKPPVTETKVKYTNILSNRSFILYFIPWLMFTLINYLTIPIQSGIYPTPDTYTFLAEVEFLVTAIVAVVIGFVADKIGRKRLSIIGFVCLGIGYAIIGLVTVDLAGTTATLDSSSNLLIADIVFMLTDGIAWGIFYVLFLFTLWGDIAQDRRSDKFYFLGALPYVSAYFMQLLFTQSLLEMDVYTIFSFASVFLFLAVLPLVYAPETLPDKIMKDRDLKSYIENARKKAVKETEKAGKSKKRTQEDKQETDEPAETGKNYEDAKKLAEKYY